MSSHRRCIPAHELGFVLHDGHGRAVWVLHLQKGGSVELARSLVGDPLDVRHARDALLHLLLGDLLVQIATEQTSDSIQKTR